MLGVHKKLTATTAHHKEAMEWFNHRKHEYERLLFATAPFIHRGSIIFDIGANIGYFSHLLLRRVNFDGTVYLFEPVPHLAELCKKTFRDAPFRVTV